MAEVDVDRLDLKIASAALQEMREAFDVFAPVPARRKVTIFGSARTLADDPLYAQARDLAAAPGRARVDGHHRCRTGDHGGGHGGRGPRPTRSASASACRSRHERQRGHRRRHEARVACSTSSPAS